MSSLLVLLLQVAAILLVARGCGALFRRFGQPQVVGEMVAGICLGPSLLGWVAPDVSAFLFPAASLGPLSALSQIGLVLFMFVIGLELDPTLLRQNAPTAIVTSLSSVAAPFALGVLLALALYPTYAGSSVGVTGFALFVGVAMSVTAFPVLARILKERGLMSTRIGAIALVSAAVNDVLAWVLLAMVLVVVRAEHGLGSVAITAVGAAGYLAIMLLVVRPWLTRLAARPRRGVAAYGAFGVVLSALLASAATTEALGLHALFGAFFLGTLVPKALARELIARIEPLTVALLLPLFFASAGLRTSIDLLDQPSAWGWLALVMGVAIAGKWGGAALGARASGVSWPEARGIGILMNTRGLMELVVVTIGLELGVLSRALYAMLVLMALLTTVMTAPWLAIGGRRA